jgi:purine nucleosidase
MVQKLLALAGHSEVPVATGAARPLLGRRPVYWAGHEGLGLLEPDDALAPVTGHAAELIAAKARENPEQLTLLAIGPLTNVALALLIEPELPRLLRGVTIMGGCVRVDDLALPRVEHNFACDPEAAHVVLSAGLPITLVPLDVTLKTRLGAGAPATIRAHRSPLNEAVARQLELYPPFVERGFTTPHDPLAAAAVLKPELVTTTPLNVSVDYTTQVDPGRLTCRQVTADIAATADVALQVDRPRFETLLLERVAG